VLHDQGSAPVGEERFDGSPLVLAQPGRARPGADEAGENGIGRARYAVLRGSWPHATRWVGHRTNASAAPWTTSDAVMTMIIHRAKRNSGIRGMVAT
jgi:hypothetical protein